MKISKVILAMMALICCFFSCNDDDKQEEVYNDPVEIVDNGSVGMVIDTRNIARKGYLPVTAEVDLPGDFSAYSGSLEIDPFTNVAILSIPCTELDSAQVATLAEGIPVTIEIKGSSSEVLASFNETVNVDHSNNPINIDTELPRIYPEVKITEGTPYFLQAITDENFTNSRVIKVNESDGRVILDKIDSLTGDNLDRCSFYFDHKIDSVYTLFIKRGNEVQWLKMVSDKLTATADDCPNCGPNGTAYVGIGKAEFLYYVTNIGQGLFRITPYENYPLYCGSDYQIQEGSYKYLVFRLVATDIEWLPEDRGIKFNPPVQPPVKLEYAYESIIKNCTNAEIIQTVGNGKTKSNSYSLTLEESFQLFSSLKFSWNYKAGFETNFSFFGNKSKVSIETSFGFELTTSLTYTSSQSKTVYKGESETVSWQRQINIPPYTALRVFDAIQTIENVKIPYVQVIRVRANHIRGASYIPMAGDEIEAQLMENQFHGIVTGVGKDYVDITVRGTVFVDNLFKTASDAVPIEGACSM